MDKIYVVIRENHYKDFEEHTDTEVLCACSNRDIAFGRVRQACEMMQQVLTEEEVQFEVKEANDGWRRQIKTASQMEDRWIFYCLEMKIDAEVPNEQ